LCAIIIARKVAMRKELKEILDREFFEKLPNKDVKNNKPCLVCFSGTPKSGKSHLAKEIERQYQGVNITKDIARKIIFRNEGIKDLKVAENLLDEYFTGMIDKLVALPNKLIIWNFSIDRGYRKYQEMANKYRYRLFVISLDTPKDIVIQRIKTEEDALTAKWFLEQLDRWTEDYQEYNKSGQVDFVIKNKSEEDIVKLFEKLDQLLA